MILGDTGGIAAFAVPLRGGNAPDCSHQGSDEFKLKARSAQKPPTIPTLSFTLLPGVSPRSPPTPAQFTSPLPSSSQTTDVLVDVSLPTS